VDPANLRIGTRERDDALQMLGEHFTQGRLPVTEYDTRVTKAIDAQTRADIQPLFDDLPLPFPAFLAKAPATWQPPMDRTRGPAGVLQIFLPFGAGRFYLGDYPIALAQLLSSFVGIGVLWCWIDGILLLVNGSRRQGG
jgi:uncharacterized protein DUF1707/TM2 domain-containing protein